MAAMTAAQRKKAERQREKNAGLKTWKAEIDLTTREALKRLTAAYGTRSQEKTFFRLIHDAIEQLDKEQATVTPPNREQEKNEDVASP